MNVIHETVGLPPGDCMRLLSWQWDARCVQLWEPNGVLVPHSGVGSRWHQHAEMELTHFLHGRGLRYVGDHVEPFSAGDTVLLGSELPHCWLEHDATAGFALQFRLPAKHPLWRVPASEELRPLLQQAQHGIRFDATLSDPIRDRLRCLAQGSRLARFGSLVHTQHSIAEIAFACGFGSLSRFNATFLARYGQTPRAVRQAARHVSRELGLTSH